MNEDSRWVCIRLVRSMLKEADLFDKDTNSSLANRIAVGLLPIRAKKGTYSEIPFGITRKTLDDPIPWTQIAKRLGSCRINFDDRTITDEMVRGGRNTMYNFIAFDVEFGRAEILEYIGPENPISRTPPDAPRFSGRFQPYLEEMHKLITEDGVSIRQASLSCAQADGIDLITNGNPDSIAAMLRSSYSQGKKSSFIRLFHRFLNKFYRTFSTVLSECEQ